MITSGGPRTEGTYEAAEVTAADATRVAAQRHGQRSRRMMRQPPQSVQCRAADASGNGPSCQPPTPAACTKARVFARISVEQTGRSRPRATRACRVHLARRPGATGARLPARRPSHVPAAAQRVHAPATAGPLAHRPCQHGVQPARRTPPGLLLSSPWERGRPHRSPEPRAARGGSWPAQRRCPGSTPE